MKKATAALLFLPALVCAQAKMEKPPSFEAYLAAETRIEPPPAVVAPEADLRLKGMRDDRPETRSPASVADEVRANQSHLNSLYKTWRMKGIAIDRFFGISLTIGPEGDVQKAAAHGVSDKEFKARLEAAILSWSFSRVKAKQPMQANLKHLDFLYRQELLVN